ncbi:GNAT family N-acetyltransferase [Micromonospora carbonacea]|nr:GNAT family N-acetyltransferase [Micromonospora carbonacea]MBB5829528.1 GNAT superfamily N-acetyltransferase [Micromonospora carbonacea]
MTMRSHRPPSSIHKIGEVEVIARAYDHPDAVRLLAAFYQEQVERYGFADPVEADPAEYAHPHGHFVVAYHRGAPAGCGGYRWYERTAGTIEIKKLYALPDARGLSIGSTILSSLEEHAGARGARRIILETGVRNHAAIRLFHAIGYRPIARYVAIRDPKINRAFAKSLVTSVEDVNRNALQGSA